MLQLEREFRNVSFRVSYRNQQKRLICVKAKNLDKIDICSVEKLKLAMATMQVLSSRYFFLQRMITEHISVLLVGRRSRSNFVEEIKFLL